MITPLEIRQHSFPKKTLGGYDIEEVRAFLQNISQEWEKVLEENRKMKGDLDKTKSSLEHYKEMETILHKTMLQAEQSSKSTLENAKKDAELKIQEAEYKANEILSSIQADKRQLEREIHELVARRNDILQQLISPINQTASALLKLKKPWPTPLKRNILNNPSLMRILQRLLISIILPLK